MNCSHCGAPNREGEMICKVCGHMLVDALATRQIEAVSEQAIQQRGPRVTTDHLQRVMLKIGEQVLDFPVHHGCEIIVGRGVKAGPGQQPLDLTSLGGLESGVSRQHAAIRIEGDSVYVIDLASTNGTFLNGERLQPEHHHLVYSNDILRFGALEVRIRLT